ncbi:MAG: hypothetical protein PHU62_06860 [Bacteroidales bacterium]|jgi:hypothetical protein|nr:hypothetical protein [Bacteroidales bacterium]MDD2205480.1 hypothetical protein [Bacteroidales bacterium]MDD3914445.1 hypothetical protein [Bacteroidales bacterium]MDD4634273.1 hypothetical protein [Bacteroidales bacterium]
MLPVKDSDADGFCAVVAVVFKVPADATLLESTHALVSLSQIQTVSVVPTTA